MSVQKQWAQRSKFGLEIVPRYPLVDYKDVSGKFFTKIKAHSHSTFNLDNGPKRYLKTQCHVIQRLVKSTLKVLAT